MNYLSSPLGVRGKHEIDLSTWKHREHFEVFKNFDEPLFGITVKVECSAAYKKAKELGYSFSNYYLYLSLKVANEIEEFRYRIEDDKVYCYDSVGAGPTIFRKDETYGCGYMHYSTLPWADFTAVNHARRLDIGRSIPKITFGKLTREGEKMWLPVDIHANHAVMDGFHVGKFVERFQELLNQR